MELIEDRSSAPRGRPVARAGLLGGGAITDGLRAIHRVGVIHRDPKTANIMLDPSGTVRLMDFGIAKQVAQDATATTTGHIVGTPAYMSPEQARGEKLDFRSDIYSLGVVLYELFSGRVPFEAETPVAVILKHIHDPPPLAGPPAEKLPPSLLPVLARALAKSRSDRFQTASELGQAARGGGTIASPPRSRSGPGRRCRRSRRARPGSTTTDVRSRRRTPRETVGVPTGPDGADDREHGRSGETAATRPALTAIVIGGAVGGGCRARCRPTARSGARAGRAHPHRLPSPSLGTAVPAARSP